MKLKNYKGIPYYFRHIRYGWTAYTIKDFPLIETSSISLIEAELKLKNMVDLGHVKLPKTSLKVVKA